MAQYHETHFDEKSGIVDVHVKWGRWWQTVSEVHIEVDIDPVIRSKLVTVDVKPSSISVTVSGTNVIQGNLFSVVTADETLWTIEDVDKNKYATGKVIHIVLTKLGGGRLAPKRGEIGGGEGLCESLIKGDEETKADPITLHEMRKKLDLERFQIENPGFDFSGAKLAKCYDKASPASK